MAETPAYVVVDHILKAENEQITEQNTFNISFTELVEGDKEAIGDWIIDSLNYSEIHGAPALPIDKNEASDAYDTVNNERVIKPLQEVAFTADYDDLTNAPTIPDINGSRPTEFNQIAFTGQVDMDNSGLKIAKIFDLTQYQLWDVNNKPASFNTDVQNLHDLGNETIFIKGFNTGNYGQALASDIGALVTAFNNQSSIDYQRPTFIKSNTGLFQIIKAQLFRNGPDTVYYKIDTILTPDNNYSFSSESSLDPQINNGLIYVTDEQANIILNNLIMNDPSLISFVFDMAHCIILCQVNILNTQEETDPIFMTSAAANITDNDINNWNNKGTSNFDGNYINLNNKPNIPIIYNYDFLEYDIPELKNLLNRPYVFNTITTIIDTTNNISLDSFLQTIIQNYEHSSATVQINFFTINHIKFSISYIYTNEGVFTFNFYDKYFTNYLNLKDLNKTSSEILEELNVTGQDQLIWEYDPEQHLLFII